jgi:hypothetical protein
VTWNGYVMQTNGKKVYAWEANTYKGKEWSKVRISKKNEAYHVFLVDFGKHTPKTLKAGDKGMIPGTLMPRGAAKQNLHGNFVMQN